MKQYVTLLSLILEGVREVVKAVKAADKEKEYAAIKRDVYAAWSDRFGSLRESDGDIGIEELPGPRSERRSSERI